MQEIMKIKSELLLDITKQFEATGNDEAVMNYNDDYWMMKSQSPDDVVFAAAKVGANGMKEYTPPDHGDMGIRLKTVKDFLSGHKGIVTVSTVVSEGSNKMALSTSDGKKCTIPYTDAQYVSGNADAIPNVDYGINFTIGSSRFTDFISTAGSIVDGSSFFISAGSGIIALYSERDNYSYEDVIQSEDLPHFSAHWDVCADPNKNNKIPAGAQVPTDAQRTDTILSLGFVGDLHLFTDNIKISCDNHCPVKFVMDFDTDSNYEDIATGAVKCSYITAPRLSSKTSRATLPDDVMPEREVLGDV